MCFVSKKSAITHNAKGTFNVYHSLPRSHAQSIKYTQSSLEMVSFPSTSILMKIAFCIFNT